MEKIIKIYSDALVAPFVVRDGAILPVEFVPGLPVRVSRTGNTLFAGFIRVPEGARVVPGVRIDQFDPANQHGPLVLFEGHGTSPQEPLLLSEEEVESWTYVQQAWRDFRANGGNPPVRRGKNAALWAAIRRGTAPWRQVPPGSGWITPYEATGLVAQRGGEFNPSTQEICLGWGGKLAPKETGLFFTP